MNVILFLLVSIFGRNVECTKIRAIRRRTYQYLPTEIPEVPAQTQYNWEQWWRSPVYKSGRLVYSYDDPNGIRFNIFGGGPYRNQNYVDGRQIYQYLGQSQSGGLGQSLHGIGATDTTESGSQYSVTLGGNGVRIVPALGGIPQKFATLGQISSDLSGAHASVSAHSSQIVQNIGRSKTDVINPIGDNAENIISVKDSSGDLSDNVLNIINANDDNGNVVSLVPDNLELENNEAVGNEGQSDLNQIKDTVSGNNAISPDDGTIYAVDQNKPSLPNDGPLTVADEINVNDEDALTTLDQDWPKFISPGTNSLSLRRPNLWRYYKYPIKISGKVNGNENNKRYDFPMDIDQYQQQNRGHYDMWRQYIGNRHLPAHFHYKPHLEYADWPTKKNRPTTPVICRKKHINMLQKEKYYDSENLDSRPLVNNANYFVNEIRTNLDNVDRENSDDLVSYDYLENHKVPDMNKLNDIIPKIKPIVSKDDDTSQLIYKPLPYDIPAGYNNIISPEVRPLPTNVDALSDIYTLPPYDRSFYNHVPREYKNIFIPKVRPFPSNEDTPSDIYTPAYDTPYSNHIPSEYKNIFTPKVKPMPSNEDTSLDIYTLPPDDPLDSNHIPREYNNIFSPEVRPLPSNEDTSSDIYTPPSDTPYSNYIPREYKNILTPKVRPLPSNEDTPSDIYTLPPYDDTPYSNHIPREYKNIFIPKVRPLPLNEDTPSDIYTLPPHDPLDSNHIPREYNNIFTPEVRPLPSNEDTSSDIYTLSPYDPPYSNPTLREYKNTFIPEVRPFPSNEDTPSTTYTPLPYGYKYYPAESNVVGPDMYNSPVIPYFKPDIDDNNIIPLDPIANPNEVTELSYSSELNEDTSQSQETTDSSEEDNGATKDTPEIPDSRIIYVNSNDADINIPALTPYEDVLGMFEPPWTSILNNKKNRKLNLRSITWEQYIKQVIDALIPNFLEFYNSDCTRENEAKLLQKFKAIIDYAQSQHCDTTP